MGVFEVSPFAKGTFKIAHAMAENAAAISIVGGGDRSPRYKRRGCRQDYAYLHWRAARRSNF